MSDHKGAALLLPVLSHARELVGYCSYDTNHLQAGVAECGTTPCIPPPARAGYQYRTTLSSTDGRRIETMFGRLKN